MRLRQIKERCTKEGGHKAVLLDGSDKTFVFIEEVEVSAPLYILNKPKGIHPVAIRDAEYSAQRTGDPSLGEGAGHSHLSAVRTLWNGLEENQKE
jgi:hypothetical protein